MNDKSIRSPSLPPFQIRLKLAIRTILGHARVRNYFDAFDDDIYLVSYPKSGNTWTRFLTANLISPRTDVDFQTVEHLVADTYSHHNRYLLSLSRPRVLKSHEAYDPRFRRVILIVRDPRDVAVSYYHHQIKTYRLSADTPIIDFIPDFLAGKIDDYGPWDENIASWLGAHQGKDSLLLIRYEDLLAHSHREVSKMASFMSLDVDDDQIQAAIHHSSAEEMRKLESGGQLLKSLKSSNLKMNFVRSAKSGGWREALPPAEAKMIVDAWGPLMSRLGYLED